MLERLGHQVVVPRGQTCCGQIHFNTGYRREAFRVMERFLEVFEDEETVVAPSASCVAMVREQYPELVAWAGASDLEEGVRGLGARIRELSEFLVADLGVEDVGACFEHRVTFHPTCHSIRALRVGDAPLRLLRSVRGLELVDLPGALECCGFGGTFAVKNPHTSLAMMEDKLRAVRETGAEVLTAVDQSCLMHLAGGMRRQGWLRECGPAAGSVRAAPPKHGGVAVLHLAEILASEGDQ